MSYPVLANDIIEITIRGRLDGQRTINTFHYKANAEPPQLAPAVFDDLVAEFNINVAEPIAARQTTSQQIESIRIQRIYPNRFAIYDTPPSDLTGSIITAPLVSGASVVVRRKGDTASPHDQGRVFLPGYPIAAAVVSRLTAVEIAASETAILPAMVTSLFDTDGTEFYPIILNRASPTDSVRVTSASLDPIIRYQRRREVGKGE